MNTSFKRLALPMIVLLLQCCSSSGSSVAPMVAGSTVFANTVADESVMGKWARSCALCHVNGEAGAPVAGDVAEWQLRLEQGEESLLRRVVEGYNSMPPLGYCMSCEMDDFRAMIGFMARTNL